MQIYLLAQPHQDIYQTSKDGLKLHATWFPNNDAKKVVICCHGYTSQGMNDFTGLSDYYLKNGFAMLLIDERAHGMSEGEHIGFGCLDRYDVLGWNDKIIALCGEEVQILLHGISMGGSTVLMAVGMELPPQVKGVISDCAFTSPKYVFTHVLHTMYHLPAEEMCELINRADATVLVLDEIRADVGKIVKDKCPKLKAVISMQKTANDEQIYSFWELVNEQNPGCEYEPQPDKLCTIMFTSGTTGKSKGVMLTHRNLAENATCLDMKIPPRTTILSVLPIHHAYCLSMDILKALFLGSIICINDSLIRVAKNTSPEL